MRHRQITDAAAVNRQQTAGAGRVCELAGRDELLPAMRADREGVGFMLFQLWRLARATGAATAENQRMQRPTAAVPAAGSRDARSMRRPATAATPRQTPGRHQPACRQHGAHAGGPTQHRGQDLLRARQANIAIRQPMPSSRRRADGGRWRSRVSTTGRLRQRTRSRRSGSFESVPPQGSSPALLGHCRRAPSAACARIVPCEFRRPGAPSIP